MGPGAARGRDWHETNRHLPGSTGWSGGGSCLFHSAQSALGWGRDALEIIPTLTRIRASVHSGVPSRSPSRASHPVSARVSRISPCASGTAVAEPLERVRVDGRVDRTRSAQAKVVRPAKHDPVRSPPTLAQPADRAARASLNELVMHHTLRTLVRLGSVPRSAALPSAVVASAGMP